MQATEIPVLIFDFINISLNREKNPTKTPAVVHSSSPNLIFPTFFFYRYCTFIPSFTVSKATVPWS